MLEKANLALRAKLSFFTRKIHTVRIEKIQTKYIYVSYTASSRAKFQISLKGNRSHPCFWLTKFIQKIDANAMMFRIFLDLREKSAFYM